ncbi:uncharacterized protein LOC133524702 [Cydia pomonella]|uniref:uncharacterized protein LOC133524702 n=1 Tax=Cydia pomonella TaxID=82600 RepID=UPI002ADE558D|nr:uncharacterized protein LOC133524702 [Cydia pomonella]
MAVGKIPEFKIGTDNWRLYVDRLEQYFLVNNIEETMYVPTLITVMGAECYELLVNLCTPDKPSTKTFTQVTSILEKHLQPKPSILAERFKFRHRKQSANESISEYVAVLKRMSKHCEFGTWLEESLRDQLVCGLQSETIRQRLFTEESLDFAKAYKLAVSMEAAEKDSALVEGRAGPSSGADTVECKTMTPRWAGGQAGQRAGRAATRAGRGGRAGAIGGGGGGRARGPARGAQQCSACGGAHDKAGCQFARYVCRVCNRQGHLKRMCPNMTEQYDVHANTVVDEENAYSEDSDEFQIL